MSWIPLGQRVSEGQEGIGKDQVLTSLRKTLRTPDFNCGDDLGKLPAKCRNFKELTTARCWISSFLLELDFPSKPFN